MSTQVFDTPGSYTWVCPANVTSVNVVCIGAGGSGGAAYYAGGGGGGGGLGWKNNIAVTPGQSYTVVVGAGGIAVTAASGGQGTDGGDSYFISTSIVAGLGGKAGVGTSDNSNVVRNGGLGGSFVGDGGGIGGTGGASSGDTAGGGGGAAGYSGNGGNGGWTAGAGGGAAGGANGGSNSSNGAAQSGGGVGVSGQGDSGTVAGSGGSGGTAGSANLTSGGSSNTGGLYGGGGAGQSNDSKTTPGCNGGGGAVRIVWATNATPFPFYSLPPEPKLGILVSTNDSVQLTTKSRLPIVLASEPKVELSYRGSTFIVELFTQTTGAFQRWTDS